MSKFLRSIMVGMAGLVLTCGPAQGLAQGLESVQTADGTRRADTRNLIQWTHTRLVFNKELERVAVGQQSTLEVEVLSNNEVLALAKDVGRTSLTIWYTDKTTETFLFSVVQDLSVLRRALRDVHPDIRLELAPDRAALVLRGRVPTVKFRLAAESIARNYLEVGNNKSPRASDILVRAAGPGASAQDSNLRVSSGGVVGDELSSAVINLIQVDTLPQSREDKVRSAIRAVGGKDVIVRRDQVGDFADDSTDTITLSGYVETQVDLSRVLNVASRMFVSNQDNRSQGVSVLSDEAGGQLGSSSGQRRSGGDFGSSSSTSGDGGVDNDIYTNIGRSKLVSLAGGRILSMIEVRDLPQVRVSVQMHEVNRARLKTWRPDMSLITDGYASGGTTTSAVTESTVENALQILGGALTNNVQVATGSYAFDLLFSLLEEEGISRSLSRPTLTVLAGETAVFRAGGEVPVPSAFAPSGISTGDNVGANTSGVFSGTQFKAFGVELKVRAMVDENDRITLDVNPSVSRPDTVLTQQIANSTGTNLNTAAFNTRSINTSTRLQDGQPLIIGGLVSRDVTDNESYTPGLNQIPLLGRLAESSSKGDTDKELIIVVTPTIIREAKHDVALWQYPSSHDLLNWAVLTPGAPSGTRGTSRVAHAVPVTQSTRQVEAPQVKEGNKPIQRFEK